MSRRTNIVKQRYIKKTIQLSKKNGKHVNDENLEVFKI